MNPFFPSPALKEGKENEKASVGYEKTCDGWAAFFPSSRQGKTKREHALVSQRTLTEDEADRGTRQVLHLRHLAPRLPLSTAVPQRALPLSSFDVLPSVLRRL